MVSFGNEHLSGGPKEESQRPPRQGDGTLITSPRLQVLGQGGKDEKKWQSAGGGWGEDRSI